MIDYNAYVDGFIIAEVTLPNDSQDARLEARKRIAKEKNELLHHIRLRRKTIIGKETLQWI